jgi:hypothetical protein
VARKQQRERKRWEDSGGRNRRERGGVAGKWARTIGLALSRCDGALDRILPRRGRHGSADSFNGLSSRRHDFGALGAGRFQALSPNNAPGFGRHFGATGGDSSNNLEKTLCSMLAKNLYITPRYTK